jgi:acyl carrier protein
MMTISRAEIAEKLIELAAEQAGVNAYEITLETHLLDDLNFDSLDTIEFVMKIEEEYDVNIPDKRAEEARTIGQAAEMLLGLLAEPALRG